MSLGGQAQAGGAVGGGAHLEMRPQLLGQEGIHLLVVLNHEHQRVAPSPVAAAGASGVVGAQLAPPCARAG